MVFISLTIANSHVLLFILSYNFGTSIKNSEYTEQNKNHTKSEMKNKSFLFIGKQRRLRRACTSVLSLFIYEQRHDKTNKMCGHPPSLIRVFAVRKKKAWVLSYPLSTQWRFWSDWADVHSEDSDQTGRMPRLWSNWADAQADLSLHWAHSHIVGFFMRRLISIFPEDLHHTGK